MTTPANLPNQVGVQGIQAQMALWIARAANAVNALLGWATSPNYASLQFNGQISTITVTGSTVYSGASVALTPQKSGVVLISGSVDPFIGPASALSLWYSVSAPPAVSAAQTGTQIGTTYNALTDTISTNTYDRATPVGPVIVSGLTLGTTYHFMMGINITAGGSVDFFYPSFVAVEL